MFNSTVEARHKLQDSEHEGCPGWARSGECDKNPRFMHAHCAVACKSCNKVLDGLDKEETRLGDWKYYEGLKVEHKNGATAYVAEAGLEELVELEEAIVARREALMAKHEL